MHRRREKIEDGHKGTASNADANSFSDNRVVPVSEDMLPGPVAEAYIPGMPLGDGAYVDSESDDDDMYGAGNRCC